MNKFNFFITLGKMFQGLSTQSESKEPTEVYYEKQRLAFYEVVLEKEISSRFLITTTLITLSSACLAVIPSIVLPEGKDLFFPGWIQVFLWIAFISLGLNIMSGLWMYSLDSRQLGYLKRLNDGNTNPGKDVSGFTSFLQIIQYFLFTVSVISVVVISIWRVIYS